MLFDRYVVVHFTAAEPETVLTKITEAQINLENIVWVDHLDVELTIKFRQLSILQRIFKRRGIDYRIIRKEGALWPVFHFLSRPLLMIGFAAFFLLTLIASDRILFIEIEGKETLSNYQILQHAEDSGVYFGMKASEIRSEDVKNELLQRIQELQWAGVTTSGCIATVQIKERRNPNDDRENDNGVSSIVAAHDGVVSGITVYAGTPICQIGQSVKSGDVLISGYTDCGIKMIAQQASGEVFAHTRREINVVSPIAKLMRGDRIRDHICYRLHFGKKVINLCNHSGISDATCVKMYSEYFWNLPGDFRLPVSLVKVVSRYHDLTPVEQTDSDIQWIVQYAKAYLQSQMIAGSIMDESKTVNTGTDYTELIVKYACHEMIGQEKHEEIIN